MFGGFGDIIVFYSKYSLLNFSSLFIGYFFVERLFFKGVGVVLGILLMIKVFKWFDFFIVIFGVFIFIGFYFFIGFLLNRWMMFVG